MNGDRLKVLEAGFLEGNLTPAEEAELKTLVSTAKEHHLKTYFEWTSEAQDMDVPDMSTRMHLEEELKPFWQIHFLKIAAVLLILLMATFIFRQELFKSDNKQVEYSQTEIDESYEATIATLTAMASFLDKNLNTTEQGMDFSAPFKELNTLQNNETQKP